MGVGSLIRDFFSSGAKKLAKTNRAYYKRSLFLVVACRSLPEPETSWNPLQLDNLKKLFGSVQSALDHGTFAHKGSKDVDERFSKANDNLEMYLKIFHRGARFGSYVSMDGSPLLTFEEATQRDRWAEKTLNEFSETINEKVESIKHAPQKTIDITFWGPTPVVQKKGSLAMECKSIQVPCFIRIETTARIDALLHRAMEYATMIDDNDDKPIQKLKSLKLDLSPQFYDTSPMDEERFAKKFAENKEIVSLEPWRNVSDLHRPLHILANRISTFMGSVELKSAFDSFYKEDMREAYTNAWPFINNDGEELGEYLAVRNRNASHSLGLLKKKVTFPKPPFQPPSVPSSSTLVDPSMRSSSSFTLVPPHDSPSFPEPIVMPIPDIPDPHQTLRPPMPTGNRPPPVSSTSQGRREEIPQIISSIEGDQGKSGQNYGNVQIMVPNPSHQSDQHSSLSSSRPETPNPESLDGLSPRLRPTYTARRHRIENSELGREDVTAKEKPKQQRGLFGRLRSFFG